MYVIYRLRFGPYRENCDRGLENAAQGRRPRAAISRPRSQFFTIRTEPKPVNNFFFCYLGKKCNCIIRAHPMFNRSLSYGKSVLKNDLHPNKINLLK